MFWCKGLPKIKLDSLTAVENALIGFVIQHIDESNGGNIKNTYISQALSRCRYVF